MSFCLLNIFNEHSEVFVLNASLIAFTPSSPILFPIYSPMIHLPLTIKHLTIFFFFSRHQDLIQLMSNLSSMLHTTVLLLLFLWSLLFTIQNHTFTSISFITSFKPPNVSLFSISFIFNVSLTILTPSSPRLFTVVSINVTPSVLNLVFFNFLATQIQFCYTPVCFKCFTQHSYIFCSNIIAFL